jgi:hypothetical protein
MNDRSCRRCGNKALLCGFISMRCPICGECVYNPDACEKNQWSEHKLGLMFKRDGWRWISVLEPPAWFLESIA